MHLAGCVSECVPVQVEMWYIQGVWYRGLCGIEGEYCVGCLHGWRGSAIGMSTKWMSAWGLWGMGVEVSAQGIYTLDTDRC